MRILFQGDSITDAYRRPEELNPAFQLGNGYAFLVASRLGLDLPHRRFQFINRGISGNGVGDLLSRWQADTVEIAPHVLSLLIGVNEIIRAMEGRAHHNLESFSAVYRQLLEEARASNPDIHLILMEPFLLTVGDVTAEWHAYLAPYRAEVAKIAKEYHTQYIPLQQLFDNAATQAPPEYWAWDGIHPSHAGFQLIADAWLEATRTTLFS